MILVTGTKRSGTSMWMQALRAAGFPVFGEAFPRNWGEKLRDANPAGFYESALRQGIFFATNPHPETGAYFFPEQVEGHAVKVFIPGVIRTDRAYLGSVIATMRPWREYVASIARLYAMEAEQGVDRAAKPMSAALEWWNENYCLVRDVVTRRYRFHYVAYETVLRDPLSTLEAVTEWLGGGDATAAAAVIEPSLHTQQQVSVASAQEDELTDAQRATFDAFYERIRDGLPLSAEFVERLNETNAELAPQIREQLIAQERVRRARRK